MNPMSGDERAPHGPSDSRDSKKQVVLQNRRRYGLIAGNGQFPFLVLEAARSLGVDVVVVAIKEEAFPRIAELGYKTHWISLGQLGKLIELFEAGRDRSGFDGGSGSAQADLQFDRAGPAALETLDESGVPETPTP